MKVLAKIGAFLILFVVFLIIRFPYDSLVERAVRQAELATNATILYRPSSAGPFGVKVKDLSITLSSGTSLSFDSARIFPTRGGLRATAYQGENEMKVNFSGTSLQVELNDSKVKTGTDVLSGETIATGEINYAVRTREGGGTLRLVIPDVGALLPLPVGKAEMGSTFVIRNVGTQELPRTGVSAEIKLLGGNNNASANGTVTIEGQPPPQPPLLSGNLRYEFQNRRGSVRLSGTWDKPATQIIPR